MVCCLLIALLSRRVSGNEIFTSSLDELIMYTNRRVITYSCIHYVYALKSMHIHYTMRKYIIQCVYTLCIYIIQCVYVRTRVREKSMGYPIETLGTILWWCTGVFKWPSWCWEVTPCQHQDQNLLAVDQNFIARTLARSSLVNVCTHYDAVSTMRASF